MAGPVSIWDSDAFGADWDSGLQWDVNVGDTTGDVQPYLDLITSEHNQKPKFMSMLAQVFQPLADDIAVMESLLLAFDIDLAVDSQLDIIGEWVGVTRDVAVPLTNVYFSLDTAGLGFDLGTWFSTFNPITGIVVLDDNAYRTLLRAKILSNQWDGTIPDAYAAWNQLFAGENITILIQDNQDMSMDYAILGDNINAVTIALFLGGYLNFQPAGVLVNYITQSVPDTPLFGFDVENSSISGFDVGAWGLVTPGS